LKKLLWVGDAGCPSGFAIATHQILETLRQHYDVTVLGINYNGDPHEWPYSIYAAAFGGDQFGVSRLIWMCDVVKPDVIVLQNDGWNIPYYMQRLIQTIEYKEIPVVAIVAVDGKNFNGEWLRGVSLAIFWTEFALNEARLGGYNGPAQVITLGVNLETYKPLDRLEMRHKSRMKMIEGIDEAFIVGNVNRNQPRKRWDLTIKYFAKWIEEKNINDAWLYFHAAPTGEMSIGVMELAKYYNILDRTIGWTPPAFYGDTEDEMCETYNCLDVLLSTTQGEGMGLPALEAMACGIACLLPDSSAYSEWAKDAALLVPCTSTNAASSPYKNVIGAVVDEQLFIQSLDLLYRDHVERQRIAARGSLRARESRFRWKNIGAAYVSALESVFVTKQAVKDDVDAARQRDIEAEQMQARLIERRMKIMSGEIPA